MTTLQKDNKFIINLYNIRNNVLRMLNDRGYHSFVKKYYADITFDEFKKLYRNNNINLEVYKEDIVDGIKVKTQCIIYFVDPTSQVGKVKQRFTRLMNTLEETYSKDDNIVDIIMIAEDKDRNSFMNSIAKYIKSYQKIYNSTKTVNHTLKMELFYYSEISFNITDHYLVPRHRLITKKEITQILKDKKCTLEQLPKISKDDSVAKYFGANVGDVFRISRRSPTSGISEYYRLVIP